MDEDTVNEVYDRELDAGPLPPDDRAPRLWRWLRGDTEVPNLLIILLGLDVFLHFTGWLL